MPGDPIGLQALWHDVMPHSAPALTAVKLHVFDKKKFKTLVVKQPDQRWGILEYTAACQVRYEEKLSDLGRRFGWGSSGFGHQVVGEPKGELDDGERRIGVPDGRKHATSPDVKIVQTEDLAVRVDHTPFGRRRHAGRSHMMVPRRLFPVPQAWHG